jgi:ribosomal protein S18 acetylase RimI-like enzyme
MIDYRVGNDLDLDAVIELYARSTLGERRPIDDRAIMTDMLRHANLVITAWDATRLIGIARTLTDFGYVGYLSDLAVHADYQRRGIGVQLVAQTRKYLGPRSSLVLLAAPRARGYYPKIGFERHESAWTLRASQPLLNET